MLVKFELSMHSTNSRNGVWTDANSVHTKIVPFKGDKVELAKTLLDIGTFRYNFGNGWTAAVSLEPIDSKEAIKARRKSTGFCGYDWMVDSIIKNNKIINSDD